MSSSKGNNTRKRPQKHQNRTAFRNDLHDTSRKTKMLKSLEVTGVCGRCKSIIDWKIKYKKYKPLSAPAKCVGCEQKSIKHAYHVLCSKCSTERKVCAKCCKTREEQEVIEQNKSNIDLQSLLKGLSERKRRTVLRYLKKNHDGDQNFTSENMAHIEDVLSKMDNINLDDEDFNSDLDDLSD